MSLLLAVALLAAVLTAATLRPFGLPEAVVAVPAALLAVAAGLVTPDVALDEIAELAPTVGFLAAILLLGHLADVEGVFRWLGARLGSASGGMPGRLLVLVFGAAAGTTAVLSLDATVVLLTPVVLATAARLRLPSRPHSYACAHLSNSGSGLLPVSNLTNLLAFPATGLSFLGFAGLMVGPWAAVLVVEYLVLRRYFARDLRGGPGEQPEAPERGSAVTGPAADSAAAQRAPAFALAVLAATLAGFGMSSALGVGPGWIAAAGAAVLAVRALLRRETGPVRLVTAISPGFCLFVLALGVVVAAVAGQELAGWLGTLLPDTPDLTGLLLTAVVAAVLANLVNNLPATLVMLAALGPSPHTGLVLAMLLGVNIGPNLTYAGSLATLLWRRIAAGAGDPPRLGTFVGLGAVTVPLGLLASTLALWASLALLT
ncbi:MULTISPECIES: SLC13 family permease [Pseudonocardia]|uniref:Arsenical pump membrane protein n=2 Tax=Pseudonocardia TaxID=1847 RepID=A0A1Y2N0M4_PSEAH|nr:MULTISPECIES: SLC13 family permease [Pseudonocardia]OSY40458.1 Arsenical pump membrane protein [Pseudonocardia autotrophica]TDN72213.1 arsenite efflux membrane protein ArsB [Pseudonocardia autotrophica]BBG02922.1 arsenic transporter [Pseudonocardia autotrophica]GEC25176.1 arsenic transporter [Pseudonocardia saturnea]